MHIYYPTKTTLNIKRAFTFPGGKTVSFARDITNEQLASYEIYPFVTTQGDVVESTYSLTDGIVTLTVPTPEPAIPPCREWTSASATRRTAGARGRSGTA